MASRSGGCHLSAEFAVVRAVSLSSAPARPRSITRSGDVELAVPRWAEPARRSVVRRRRHPREHARAAGPRSLRTARRCSSPTTYRVPPRRAARLRRPPDTPCSTARPPEPTRRTTRSSLWRSCASIGTESRRRGTRNSSGRGRPIPASATAVHGIAAADVADAPSFADIAGELRALLGDAVFVAHNVELRPAGAPARVRSGRDRLRPGRRRLHPRGVPAPRAARREPPAAVDLRTPRNRAPRTPTTR